MHEAEAVGILILVIGLLVSGKVRIDLVGVIALALVGLLHLIPSSTLFSGFSSYAAIILAEMFVLSEGLRRSGATEVMAGWFERLGKKGETPLLTALMALPPIPSTFVSDVGLMSIFLPTMVRIRQRLKFSLHRLLMPLSFSIALGGLLSMIGSAGREMLEEIGVDRHDAILRERGAVGATVDPHGGVAVVVAYDVLRPWSVFQARTQAFLDAERARGRATELEGILAIPWGERGLARLHALGDVGPRYLRRLLTAEELCVGRARSTGMMAE